MSVEPRLKLLRFCPNEIVHLTNMWLGRAGGNVMFPKELNLPEDTIVVGCFYEPDRDTICFRLWSEEFPVVKQGEMIPALLDRAVKFEERLEPASSVLFRRVKPRTSGWYWCRPPLSAGNGSDKEFVCRVDRNKDGALVASWLKRSGEAGLLPESEWDECLEWAVASRLSVLGDGDVIGGQDGEGFVLCKDGKFLNYLGELVDSVHAAHVFAGNLTHYEDQLVSGVGASMNAVRASAVRGVNLHKE